MKFILAIFSLFFAAKADLVRKQFIAVKEIFFNKELAVDII